MSHHKYTKSHHDNSGKTTRSISYQHDQNISFTTPNTPHSPTATYPRKSHQTSASDLNSVDYSLDVVNFVSSALHPGLVKRTSYIMQPHPAFMPPPGFRKTHRRIASATPNFQHPNSSALPYSPAVHRRGHLRNISDPTACIDTLPFERKPVSPSVVPERITCSEVERSPFLPNDSNAMIQSQQQDTVPSEDKRSISSAEYKCPLPCLQSCANPVIITSVFCAMVFFQALVLSGYVASQLTTLEKRFDLNNRQMGYIAAFYEAAAVLSSLLVSVFHSRNHNRPRVIAVSSIFMSLGFALFTLPHFIAGNYKPNLTAWNSTQSVTGTIDQLQHSSDECVSINFGIGVLYADYTMALPIFCVSLFIAGLGASPIYLLVPTYLWDNLTKEQYPLYSALFSCFAALGPACGFMVGAAFHTVYIDTPLPAPTINDASTELLTSSGISSSMQLTPKDTQWLGAWWLGMLMNAGLIFFTALPSLVFPKALVPLKETVDDKSNSDPLLGDRQPANSNSAYGRCNFPRIDEACDMAGDRPDSNNNPQINSTDDPPDKPLAEEDENIVTSSGNVWDVTDPALNQTVNSKLADKRLCGSCCTRLRSKFLKSMRIFRAILMNSLWLGVTCINVFEFSIVAAFIYYAAKYIQTLFTISANVASVITGAVVVPSAVFGVIVGALLMRRFRPSVPKALQWMHCSMVLSVFTNIALLCFTCPSNKIAGLTGAYDGTSWPWSGFPTNLFPANLSAQCNAAQFKSCAKRFDPVCWKRSYQLSDEDVAGDPNLVQQLTYFSSCFAGCKKSNKFIDSSSQVRMNYSECSCVTADRVLATGAGGPKEASLPGWVLNGQCDLDCHGNYYAFLVLLSLHIFLTALHQNPGNVITLSIMDKKYSSQGLGLQLFLIRILASVPAPIYFGQLLDSVCQYRAKLEPDPVGTANCTRNLRLGLVNLQTNMSLEMSGKSLVSVQGACKAYSSLGLPIVWLGGLLCLKLASLVCLVVTWQISKRKFAVEDDARTSQENVVFLKNLGNNESNNSKTNANVFDFSESVPFPSASKKSIPQAIV